MIVDLAEQGRLDISQMSPNQRAKNLNEFQTCSQRLASAFQLLDSDVLSVQNIVDFTNRRELDQLMRNLVRNAGTDTFFLPPCTAILEAPSVALLRHIYTCRIDIFDSGHDQRVNQQPERMIRLKSPYIEALVARLAALFTRVGTRDLSPLQIDAFARLDVTQ
jgi:hypothetical protein